MSRLVVAVPSQDPDGLSAQRSEHFGRAPYFVVAETAAGGLISVRTIENPTGETSPHVQVTTALAKAGVTDVLVAGIGEGMRGKLGAAGVRIWHDGSSATVRQSLEAFVSGSLDPLGDDHTHNHHGGHAFN